MLAVDSGNRMGRHNLVDPDVEWRIDLKCILE
jgi:hypothetical protein